jgi:S-adenosyl-L-methionine hydrolase (adenosine-forming)
MQFSIRKHQAPTIAIITDFGNKDWYVASMKGQILRNFPEARMVDITHHIAPGNVWSASYVLASCIADFPAETIFLVVVDPGVGTARKCIMGRIIDYTVLCPNNGVVSHCLHRYPNQYGPFYEIIPEKMVGNPISSTFHGRDIFAPIAGKIAAGTLQLDGLGPILHEWVRLPIQKAEFRRGVIHGSVQYIDHFGNAITNICDSELQLFQMKSSAFVKVKNLSISMRSTFGEVEVGQPLTYIGSSGFLEIGVNQRSAAKLLDLRMGEPVELHLEG